MSKSQVLLTVCGLAVFAVSCGLLVHFVTPPKHTDDEAESTIEQLLGVLADGQSSAHHQINKDLSNKDNALSSKPEETFPHKSKISSKQQQNILKHGNSEPDAGDDEAISDASTLVLPPSLRPILYDVTLRPDFYSDDPSHFILEGNVTISLTVMDSTHAIMLNYRGLNFSEADIRVWSHDDEGLEVIRTQADEQNEIYTITLKKELQVGTSIQVFLPYIAALGNDLAGLYYSRYYENGRLKYMVVSHFEPNDARKAYPCLDQPDMKAHFRVSLWRKEPMVALSNMLPLRTERRGEWLIDHFEETPVPMPTYLTAFAWAEFDSLDSKATEGLKEKLVRVWGTPTAKTTGQLDYADHIATSIFDGLENLFGVPFDLNKLDNIPVREYGAGAMENWGLVTYDDTRLLQHPNYTSQYDQMQIARTMAHEMVHMWFGNKVTCKWWEDVWLHETFARYYEYYGASKTQINVNWDDLFLAQTVMNGHVLDDEGQAAPVHGHIAAVPGIAGALSQVIYDKGASMIRMLRKYAFENEEDFNRAQTSYLLANQNGNAEYSDLIKAWKPHVSSSLPVSLDSIIESWILQTGHPVLTVRREPASRPIHCATVHLSQQLFLLDDHRPIKELYPAKFNYTWVVPFAYLVQGEQKAAEFTIWMNSTARTLNIAALNEEKWILMNPGWYGFYRVNYDAANWELIIKQLNTFHQAIDGRNRAQLMFDSAALSQAGLIDADLPLRMMMYLNTETEYLPWTAANFAFNRLDTLLASTEFYGSFRAFIRSSVANLYEELGWEDGGSNEDHGTKYLRTLILELACDYLHDDCIEQASEKFNLWVKEGERRASVIDPAQRQLIGCTRLAHRASVQDWEDLFAVYGEVKDFHRQERIRVREALACTRDPWQLLRYAELALNRSTELHPDDHSAVLLSIARTPTGQNVLWSLLDQQWSIVPDNTMVLDQITSHYATEYQLQKLEEFYSRHPATSAAETEAYEASLYKVRANIRWRERIIDARYVFQSLA